VLPLGAAGNPLPLVMFRGDRASRHRPNEEAKFGDFYVGDFGSAETYKWNNLTGIFGEEDPELADKYECQTDLNTLLVILS